MLLVALQKEGNLWDSMEDSIAESKKPFTQAYHWGMEKFFGKQKPQESARVGLELKEEGYKPKHPVLIVPGPIFGLQYLSSNPVTDRIRHGLQAKLSTSMIMCQSKKAQISTSFLQAGRHACGIACPPHARQGIVAQARS